MFTICPRQQFVAISSFYEGLAPIFFIIALSEDGVPTVETSSVHIIS